MKKGIEKKKSNKLVVFTLAAAALLLLIVFMPAYFISTADNVALIKINGFLMVEDSKMLFGQSAVSSEKIVGFIKQADSNPKIKAILLDINSPGGSAVASEEIARQVKKANKPVVALVRDSATSGAYWVASAADEVVASPASIIGSIGVSASYIQFSGLMADYGVYYERLVSAEFKDIASPYKNLTDKERELLEEMLALIHDYFVSEVAANRQLSKAAVANISGTIYVGEQAKKLGLVDLLGGKEEAEELIRKHAGITTIKYVTYESKPGFFDLLANSMIQPLFLKETRIWA
jgi:protease-4